MTKTELLEEVMVGLGNIPSQSKNTIKIYLDDVIGYMLGAGVSTSLLNIRNDSYNEKCLGCITRGVGDLWNYGNGDTKLSEYFYQRCDQLRSKKVVNDNVVTYMYGTIIINTFTVQDTTDILNIGTSFDSSKDKLELYINGLKFNQTKYTLVDNSIIKLNSPVNTGTEIEIVITKLVGVNNG